MNTTRVFANMSAVFSSGRLDAEKLRRIVECKGVAEAFKMLGDYGYAYSEGQSVDGFIVGETNRLIQFVTENSPSAKLAEALLARFKYNNAKLAYKSRFISVPSDGYYDVDLPVSKIADGDYDDLDRVMAQALTELDEQKEESPLAIDLALTRAMYAYVLSLGMPIVKKYFRAEIDMKNILTYARMKKLGISGDQFISGGKIDCSKFEDDFMDCLERTPYAEYAERVAENDFSDLWKSEMEADDYLYCLTRRDVADYGSLTPFLNYYTETLIELKTVKTALVCIKTNSRDLFYKRIPEIYR
ncbi:MAG: V-type ATPase subunit [Clostridiales bacterium]|nr:V-type ATPase subunit [Clostridiales bacterium]